MAERPNQLWSCDIKKLPGPARWSYFHLSVILDIFGRFIVGWMVAERESATLAERLIAQTCQLQNIQRGQLTIRAERGSSMTCKQIAHLLADLGMTPLRDLPESDANGSEGPRGASAKAGAGGAPQYAPDDTAEDGEGTTDLADGPMGVSIDFCGRSPMSMSGASPVGLRRRWMMGSAPGRCRRGRSP